MLRIILLQLAIIITVAASAQFRLSGTILDGETGQKLPAVTVRLQQLGDSAKVWGTTTDTAGRFVFVNIPADSFRLYMSLIGYGVTTRTIPSLSSDLDLGDNYIVDTGKMLSGVVVTSRVPPVTQKGDTVQYNANQFKVNPDASAEDLVRKMPGITVENGQVKAHGENVQKVTLDGRELFGDDATAALRNLPAEIIERIQVFDRLSDQAQFSGVDDGNTSKSINIVTKAGMRNGQFGRVFAGYGTDNRYQLGGNTTFLNNNRRISVVGNFNNINQQNFSAQDLLGVSSNQQRGGGQRSGGGGGNRVGGNPGGGRGSQGGNQGGGFGGNNAGNFLVGQQNGINRTNAIGINYSDLWSTKLTVTGSYLFNNTNNTTDEQVNRQYYLEGIPSFFQSTTSASTNNNHRLNMRFEYKIDSANTLLITPSVYLQQNKSNRQTVTAFFNNTPSNRVSGTLNDVTSNRDGLNADNSILYRHAFPRRGRTFSLNLTTSYNNRTGDAYTNVFDTTFNTTGFTDSTSGRFTDQESKGYTLRGNVSYTEPIGKKGQLQLNYNPSYSNNKADQETYQRDDATGKYSIFSPDLSSRFNNTTNSQNGGLNYRHTITNGQISAGLNYQQTSLFSDQQFPRTLTVDKTFRNILPNAMIRWRPSTKHNFMLMYRANTNQPSVSQLQDVFDVTNLPFVTAGNPQLEQQYTHQLSTRYTFTNTQKGMLFVANVFLQSVNDYITNATFVPLQDSTLANGFVLRQGQQLTMPVNLSGYRSVRSFVTFAMPVAAIKSNVNVNGGVSYSRLPGIINNAANISDNVTYNIGSVLSSNISQYVDFTVSYAANFNTVKNRLQVQNNSNFFSHTASVQLNLLSKTGWFLQNDFTNLLYSGLTEGFNQSYSLWNVSAGKKFLKNQQAELRLSVFDVLKQNRSIARTITENYIEDERNQVLQRYLMLTFSYNLRNFGSKAASTAPARTR